MERASSMVLQGPRDDIIVPLLHLTMFLCLAMSVMLFMEKVYMAIIILVKFFRKRPGRRPERRYIWEPMRKKDDVLIQIPMCNEKEVYKLSIGAACRLSWTLDRIIVQVLDDSTDPIIKARVVERNKEVVMEDEKENERNQEEEREGWSKVEATKDENIRTEKGRRNRGGDTVEERKSQAKRRKEGPALAGESKDEVKGEMTREAELVGFQKAEVNQHDEGRKKRKQQCRGVRSCMAMGCAAIAGFTTSALILVALANIRYVQEETVYLFPT